MQRSVLRHRFVIAILWTGTYNYCRITGGAVQPATVSQPSRGVQMPKLVCTNGLNKDDEFQLGEGATIIGRAADCNIILFDKKCSRRHCQVYKKGNYYAVEDLESRHGTLVNSKPVKGRTSLGVGDKIRIGGTTLILSNKAVGNIVDQTASDVAADLQGKKFDKLFGTAAADVRSSMERHHEKPPGLKEKLRSLFGKK